MRVVFAAAASSLLLVGAALPAWAAQNMTITFVRHGESEGNASGIIDTSTPGPHLTELGQQQAEDVGNALAGNSYDGIYYSDMVRTKETAQPLIDKTGVTGTELPGLHEIKAGIFEGQPESSGIGRIGYVLGPLAWTLGARFIPIPGAEDGNAFDYRVDDAIQQIYDKGDVNEDGRINDAVFSHGATIMFWTMMNVDNPDLGLILSHPLSNTDIVVVDGNPEDGWTLTSWAGQPVDQDPSLGTKLFVDVRDLAVAPQTAIYKVGQAFASGDVTALASAVRDGVLDVAKTTANFVPDLVNDVVGEIGKTAGTTQLKQPASTDVPDVAASVKSDVDKSTVADNARKLLSAPTPKGADKAEKATGTTELKSDEDKTELKVTPEKPTKSTKAEKAETSRDRQGSTTADNVRKQIKSSVKQTGDAVRKAVSAASHGTKPDSHKKADAGKKSKNSGKSGD